MASQPLHIHFFCGKHNLNKGKHDNSRFENTRFTECFKDGLSLRIKKTKYVSVLQSHTILKKLRHCGRHRQLNSVLYPNNHILKSSKIVFNEIVLKYA